MTLDVEHIVEERDDIIEYFEKDRIRNLLEIYNLKNERHHIDLYLCRDGKSIQGHLMKYYAPEATYVDVFGEKEEAIIKLIDLLSEPKFIIITDLRFSGLVRAHVAETAFYPDDLMLVRRGEEKLVRPNPAAKLSKEHASQYSEFFKPSLPIDWTLERLERDSIYGIFENGKLVSVAGVEAKLSFSSLITGVETHMEYRGRGYGTLVISAATEEALKHSETSSLYVRSSNLTAIRIYEKLGYKKIGEEAWIDVGTGLVP